MTRSAKPAAARKAARKAVRPPGTAFAPVPTRATHNGWTPDRQMSFIDALAASGCVKQAADAVGLSRESAYRLRARPDARAFRLAWDAALDYAIRRLSDEALSRALNGTAVPHYYKGELVGEHRRYDTKLTLFLLRYRDPLRYARTLDAMVYEGHVEHAAFGLTRACNRMLDEAHGFEDEAEAIPKPGFTTRLAPTAGENRGERDAAKEAAAEAAHRREQELPARLQALMERFEADQAAQAAGASPDASDPGPTPSGHEVGGG